jgi:hypothetical protein
MEEFLRKTKSPRLRKVKKKMVAVTACCGTGS